MREAVEWCGDEITTREATRLRRLTAGAQVGEAKVGNKNSPAGRRDSGHGGLLARTREAGPRRDRTSPRVARRGATGPPRARPPASPAAPPAAAPSTRSSCRSTPGAVDLPPLWRHDDDRHSPDPGVSHGVRCRRGYLMIVRPHRDQRQPGRCAHAPRAITASRGRGRSGDRRPLGGATRQYRPIMPHDPRTALGPDVSIIWSAGL